MNRIIARPSCLITALIVGVQSAAIACAEPLATPRKSNGEWLVAARQARLRLEKFDANFLVAGHDLETALERAIERVSKSLTPSDLTYEREALAQLDLLIEDLIDEINPVITAQEAYLKLGQEFREELLATGPTFKAAADQCRGFAAEESYSDFRDDYLCMAGILDQMAIRCENFPGTLSTQVQSVEELFPYLLSGRQVLLRFHGVLSTIPVLNSEKELNAIDVQLRKYIQSYEGFRDSLQELHERLQSPTPSDTDSHLATSGSSTAPLEREPSNASHSLRFANWQSTREQPTASGDSRVEKAAWAVDSNTRRNPVVPTRHMLVFVLPGTTLIRRSEITGEVKVQSGVPVTISIPGAGTFEGTVRDKLYSKDQGKTQYWSGKFDPPSNSR